MFGARSLPMQSASAWAESEFGEADLGDVRRTRRLVRLAAEVATRPAGTVTRACASSASREAAFRLLENTAIRPDSLRAATVRATGKRCFGRARVIVPVDATALTLTDGTHAKGLGAVGAWGKGARGVHVMNALALADDGSTLGLCAQRMWVRRQRSVHGDRHDAEQPSETDHWLHTLLEARSMLAESAPGCEPWFQIDRGGDCWQVLALAHHLDLLLTVRASHDRRIENRDERLWAAVAGTRVIAKRSITIRSRPPRIMNKRVGGNRRRVKVEIRREQARIARVEIRAVKLPLVIGGYHGFPATFHAVLVREVGHRGDDAIEWMLLTTHPIDTRAQVLDVVRGYCLRWRVEEFHRVWKRGLCRVEETQLRSRDAIFKWATLLAAVATRSMRLTQLARTTPDVPATSELSPTEIEALLALRQPMGATLRSALTLAQAVRWLADLGGYTGPSNGPPGVTTIGRGLQDVLVAARAFENRDKMR